MIGGTEYIYDQDRDVVREACRPLTAHEPFYDRTVVSTPVDLCVELTTWCNWSCQNCFSESARGRFGIHADCSSIIEHIRSNEPNLIRVAITGGEPLLHPEARALVDLSLMLPSCGFVMSTNGSVRSDLDSRLIDGQWLVGISLHGRRQAHNKYVQADSFEAVTSRIQTLAAGTVVHIYSVLHDGMSEEDLDWLIRFREDSGATLLRFIMPRPYGRFSGLTRQDILLAAERRVAERVVLKIAPSRTQFLAAAGQIRLTN